MNCKDVVERLDNFVDGQLSVDESSQVREHLADCETCRAELAGLQALAGMTATLPESIAPAHGLWGGIETRLTSRRTAAWHYVPFAVAAVLLVCVGILLERYVFERPDTGRATEAVAAGGAAYSEARNVLLSACVARGDTLPPETVSVIRDNLAVIDNALGEIRAALATDPGNARLLRMLVNTQSQGLKAVRRTSSLLDET